MSDPGAVTDAPAPNAPTQTEATPGPRASFAERVLEGAELAHVSPPLVPR